MTTQINTRVDLDSLKGTPAYAAAMANLNGSLTIRIDTAVYPEGYGQPGYAGAHVDAVWADQENLQSIERLGFTKDTFLAAYAAVSGQ
jgi:hypothetical protein